MNRRKEIVQLFTERGGKIVLGTFDLGQIDMWMVIDDGAEEGEGIIEVAYSGGGEDSILVDPEAFNRLWCSHLRNNTDEMDYD